MLLRGAPLLWRQFQRERDVREGELIRSVSDFIPAFHPENALVFGRLAHALRPVQPGPISGNADKPEPPPLQLAPDAGEFPIVRDGAIRRAQFFLKERARKLLPERHAFRLQPLKAVSPER